MRFKLALMFLLLGIIAPGCTKEEVQEAAEKTYEVAKEKGAQGVDYASRKIKELRKEDPGELSRDTMTWLKVRAEATEESVEAIIVKGEQVAETSKRIHGHLKHIVDSDVQIEPIFQNVADPEAQAKVDKAIGDMPKQTVIDGVTVGLENMSGQRNEDSISKSAYLVLWRRTDYLVGFVYRSEREIDYAELIKRAPSIISEINGLL